MQDYKGTRGSRATTRRRGQRKSRTPLGGMRQKLHATVPDGMKGRWFNDRPGRIQEALGNDYVFVTADGEETEDRSTARCEIVGTHEDGSPMKAYLMAIPKEWYEEDQSQKQAMADDIDKQIREGKVHRASAEDRDVFYEPSEGIRVRSD